MADTLQFELVSPERLMLAEPVGMVVVPGTEGNFGVLPGHSLLIATVRPGVIDVYANGLPTITERIFVSGGFAEVTPERCTVLADEAAPLGSLDRAAIEGDARTLAGTAAALRDQVARATDDERDELLRDLAFTERRLAVAQAKLDAIGAAAHYRKLLAQRSLEGFANATLAQDNFPLRPLRNLRDLCAKILFYFTRCTRDSV